MYPISNALKAKFASNAKQYARITVGNTVINNSRIRLGSFSANRYALAEDTVVFGSCVAAEFNVTLENGDGAYSSGAFLDQEAYVEVGCDLSGTVTYVPLGYYTFDMVNVQKSALKLSALDRMMKFEKTVNPTPYSISGTVDSLIDSVCTACSVTRGTFTLPVNGTLALSGELKDVKTYRDILRWIGEVTGTIAYIGYDGKLYFGWYSGTEDFSVDPANRMQGSIADDATTITSVSIVQGENMVTAGTGAKIVIRDNALIPLATGTTAQAIANALQNHVNGFTYRTFEAGVFPMPHIAPLDCGVYSDLDGNDYDVCCTDWTFTLNANTKVAGKGGKQAYGRGYSLSESVFTAANIAAGSIVAEKLAAGAVLTEKLAAGAVTADKISVSDLQALGATIGGWTITNNALEHYYTDEANNKQYLLRFISPIYGANTQGIEVLARDYPNGAFENMFAVKYTGKMIAKDADVEGKITATSGLIGNISISNGAIQSQNGAFKVDATGNIESTGGTIGDLTIESNKLYKTNPFNPDIVAYADGLELNGGYEPSIAIGGRTGRLIGNSEPEVISMLADRWGLNIEYGTDYLASDGKYHIDTEDSLYGNTLINGRMISIVGRTGTGETYIDNENLRVNSRDILRTHQSLVGGYGAAIAQNTNMNTALDLWKVGRFFCAATTTVATLTNCPTPNAFTMECRNVQGTALDGEPYQYMLREITDLVGDRYIQTGFWSNSSTISGISSWKKVLTDATFKNGTLTANAGSLSETYCRQAGRVVDIHGWLTGLSTSAQSHANAITVTGVDLPSVPIRFVFTCWLGNGIAAYAGYGVLDTNGNITFVKAVANSDKVSFAISYVV